MAQVKTYTDQSIKILLLFKVAQNRSRTFQDVDFDGP